jgi:hypothetical protein
MASLTDEQIDDLLTADEGTNEGNALAIFARIHERRRKRAHARARAAQPELGLRGAASHDSLRDKLQAFWREPITADDMAAGAGALDYLLETVRDTVDDGDVGDMIFAMARVCRKAWAWNMAHLGPIEGIPQPDAPEAKKEKQ